MLIFCCYSFNQLHKNSVYFLNVMVKQLINLSCILDLANYLSSLERWMQINKNELKTQLQQRYFNKYIQVVKPIIHYYHPIISTITPNNYAFYSDILRRKQVQALRAVFYQLSPFEIFAKEDMMDLIMNKSYNFMPASEFKLLLKKPETLLSVIPLHERPKNGEFADWGTSMPVDSVEFSSVVIHGKGIAKTQLGFPTANITVTKEIQQLINDYPNGVYLVQFSFEGGTKYGGVCCIGTNPHYQNLLNKRVIQTYVFNQFEGDFYECVVHMKLLELIRFQGKFQTFDSFLNAMHNDIYIAKKMATELHLISKDG